MWLCVGWVGIECSWMDLSLCGFKKLPSPISQLETNAILNEYVKLIEIPKKDKKIPANTKCDVAGWGATGAKMTASDVLMEATVKMQFGFECKNKWREYFFSQQMLCTHSDKKKGGICQVTEQYLSTSYFKLTLKHCFPSFSCLYVAFFFSGWLWWTAYLQQKTAGYISFY